MIYSITFRHGDILQSTTIYKRKIADARHVFRYRNACQESTVHECTTSDTCHTIRDCDARQSHTAHECTIFDTCHTVRHCNACQSTASIERRRTDACHTVSACRSRGNYDIRIRAGTDAGNIAGIVPVGDKFQAGGVTCLGGLHVNRDPIQPVKCILVNCSFSGHCNCYQRFRHVGCISLVIGRSEQISKVQIRRAVLCVSDKRKRHACQPVTAGKCISSDFCYAVRNDDLCQPAAIFECISADSCYTFRYHNTCQSTTAFKCRITNACHTVRNCNICQSVAVTECRIANDGYTAIIRDDTGCTSPNQCF